MKKYLVFFLLIVSLMFVSCTYNNDIENKKVHVVSIGIDYTSTPYSKLVKNIDDAVQVGQCIKKLSAEECDVTYLIGTDITSILKYNFEKGRVLYPTYENFKKTVKELKNSAESQDITIFYLSTHGDASDGIKDGTIKLEYNEKASDLCSIVFLAENLSDINEIKVSDFLNQIREIPGKKVVIGDLCYSGSIIEPNNIAVNVDNYDWLKVFSSFFGSGVTADPSVFCLASSSFDEVSYTGDAFSNHSLFTEVLLKGFGWNDNNLTSPVYEGVKCTSKRYLTLENIASYVRINGTEQNPVFTANSCDIKLFDLKNT